MDKFTLLKLDRAIWIAYLENKNLPEAYKYYEIYLNLLNSYDEDKDLAIQEIEFSKRLFQKKIINCANNFFNDGDYNNAVIAYSIAFKTNQNDIKLIKNYLKCLEEIKQYDLKLDLVRHLEKIADDDIEINNLLSKTYEKQNSYNKAIEYMEKCIKLNKDISQSANYYNNLGCLYDSKYSEDTYKKEDMEKALEAFSKASDIQTESRLYAKNAAIMAMKGNEYEAGKKYWQRLIDNKCMNYDDKFDYAAFSLKTGDFESWHKYFDARFKKESGGTPFPKIEKPLWDGSQDISKSTLLVRYEQGFGDTFMMWGYMPRLLKYTQKVIFIVQNEIFNLLKDNEYGIDVYAKDNLNLNELEFDYYIPSMSIPLVLKLDRSNISVGEGYIKPQKELIEKIGSKYFNNDKYKIGLSFRGSSTGTKSRDVAVKEFIGFDELNNVELYNLTKNIDDKNFEKFKHNKVNNISKYMRDFADTAAAMANCDLIVTSDNCILNLAGAIGSKTYALFNWNNNFRWFDLTGKDIIWYTSVKPYVCDEQNNWQSAIKRIITDIKNLK